MYEALSRSMGMKLPFDPQLDSPKLNVRKLRLHDAINDTLDISWKKDALVWGLHIWNLVGGGHFQVESSILVNDEDLHLYLSWLTER